MQSEYTAEYDESRINITVEKNDSDSPIFQCSEIPSIRPASSIEAIHPREAPRQTHREKDIAFE